MGGQPSSGFSIWISMGGGERSKSKIMSFSLSSQLSWKKKVEKSLDKKKKEHAQVILPVTYPPFDNFANALYPFFERLPWDQVQEFGECIEELSILLKVVEMLVHPMLEHIEYTELNWLTVFFSKAL